MVNPAPLSLPQVENLMLLFNERIDALEVAAAGPGQEGAGP